MLFRKGSTPRTPQRVVCFGIYVRAGTRDVRKRAEDVGVLQTFRAERQPGGDA